MKIILSWCKDEVQILYKFKDNLGYPRPSKEFFVCVQIVIDDILDNLSDDDTPESLSVADSSPVSDKYGRLPISRSPH